MCVKVLVRQRVLFGYVWRKRTHKHGIKRFCISVQKFQIMPRFYNSRLGVLRGAPTKNWIPAHREAKFKSVLRWHNCHFFEIFFESLNGAVRLVRNVWKLVWATIGSQSLQQMEWKIFSNFCIRKLMFTIMHIEKKNFRSRSKKIDYPPKSSFSCFCRILRTL